MSRARNRSHGFAYKPNTSDCRQSPAIDIAKAIIAEGARLAVFDPQVRPEVIIGALGGDVPSLQVTICKSAMEALEGADAMVLVTDWGVLQHT
jgi:UDPglucose 6-dehydrogenase